MRLHLIQKSIAIQEHYKRSLHPQEGRQILLHQFARGEADTSLQSLPEDIWPAKPG